MVEYSRRRRGGLLSGVIKGAIAGAVGTWMMERVTSFIYGRQDELSVLQEQFARVRGLDPSRALVNRLSGTIGVPQMMQPTDVMAKSVHYGSGIVPAMMYGALRGQARWLSKGRGLLFGTLVFLTLDEGLSPVLGLAGPPQRYPWQTHARGLAGHLVYGLTTDATLRGLDKLEEQGRTRIGGEVRRRMERPGPEVEVEHPRPGVEVRTYPSSP